VRAVIADRLAARTHACNRHADDKDKIFPRVVRLGAESALVVHESPSRALWRHPLDEVRELYRDVGALSPEPHTKCRKEAGQCPHSPLAAMLVEHLDKAAHVGPLKMR